MSAAPFMASTPADPEPLLVDARTAAGMLGISERLLWTWTQSGEIGSVRIGRRVLYPVQGLRDWVAVHTEGGPVGAGESAAAAASPGTSTEPPPRPELIHRGVRR